MRPYNSVQMSNLTSLIFDLRFLMYCWRRGTLMLNSTYCIFSDKCSGPLNLRKKLFLCFQRQVDCLIIFFLLKDEAQHQKHQNERFLICRKKNINGKRSFAKESNKCQIQMSTLQLCPIFGKRSFIIILMSAAFFRLSWVQVR